VLHVIQQALTDVAAVGLDYQQLFSEHIATEPCDLALLAVPDAPERTTEIMQAAIRSYAPRHILLLTEKPVLHHPLSDPPPCLSGYVSKYASASALSASVMLALEGGKCFPGPLRANPAGQDHAARAALESGHHNRRWYDAAPASTASSLKQRRPAPPGAPAPVPSLRSTRSPGHPPAPSAETAARESAMLGLTLRQYEVLWLLACGHPAKVISRTLKISASTVKTHVDALYQRLSVHNRSEAVFKALSRGALGALKLTEQDEALRPTDEPDPDPQPS
jgi:DNA-binding NarL/FixJ family response regulator